MVDGVFETETMAELLVKQGQLARAVSIYRVLASRSPDEPTRWRRLRRINELENMSLELSAPGIRVSTVGQEATVEWLLPPETRVPAVQVLLVRRTEQGIKVETRTIPTDCPQGQITLSVPGLHSARAAAGTLEGDRFIPVVRVD
jgi:hypothetical protein